MSRQLPQSSPSNRRNKQGVIAPLLVTGGLFGIVLAAVFYLGRTDVPQAEVAETSRPAEVLAEPQVAEPVVAVKVPAVAPVEAEPVVDAETEPSQEASPQELIEAQLAAGEFAPALKLAESVEIPAERAVLLMQIASAQVGAGDFDAAQATLGRIANQSGEQPLPALSGGGGAQADFDTLIDLIRGNVRNAAWEDEEGFGGTMSPYETGVRVDPHGLLAQLTAEETQGRLRELGNTARKADLNADMARSSSLRLVSLTRLESEISKRLAQGQPVLETMKQLAGLSAIRYVFIYPDEQEIVLGGPAEGWRYTETGQPVGVTSGRPTLQLDDFVTVLRTFSNDGLGMFNCLIVPRQEGLRKVNEFVAESNSRGPLRPGRVDNWVDKIQQLLGLQDIEVNGVPLDSRVARVIVEADYRMKLIGVDVVDGGSNIPSYFDLLASTGQTTNVPLNALRWWLTMKYDAVLHSPDRTVFEISGSSVLCRSENELITDQGQRVHTGQSDATNSTFAKNFTDHYQELADRDLVFADLQNIFDLSLVAALLRQQQAEWNAGAFAAEGAYATDAYAPPSTVMSVVNHRVYHGKDIVVQAAGGVRGDLMSVLTDDDVVQEVSRLANVAPQGRAPQLPEGRWWWDAEVAD